MDYTRFRSGSGLGLVTGFMRYYERKKTEETPVFLTDNLCWTLALEFCRQMPHVSSTAMSRTQPSHLIIIIVYNHNYTGYDSG